MFIGRKEDPHIRLIEFNKSVDKNSPSSEVAG